MARFGAQGELLHQLARGMDGRPLRPRKPIQHLRAEAELEPPVDTLDPLRFMLHNLCGALCEQLARAWRRRHARADDPRARARRGHGARRPRTAAARACGRAGPARTAALRAPGRVAASAPVTRLALELRGEQVEAGQQLGLFTPQLARAGRLDWQLVGLALRFGADRVLRARTLDPEAIVPETRIGVRARDIGHRRAGWQLMTRLLGHHPLIDVDLDVRGQPARLRWDGATEQVEVCNRWRIEEAWWRRPVSRDYYKLVGVHVLALVYLDRVDGTWHLERVYD